MKIVINLKTMLVVEDADYYPSNDEVQELFYKLFKAEGISVLLLETTQHVEGKYIGGKK